MGVGKGLTIPSREGFGKIFSAPDCRVRSGSLELFGKKNNLSGPRVGIAIKKKDYKLATNRNFIKRKIRGSFLLSCEVLPPMDFVVLVKGGVTSDCKKLRRDLLSLWTKTKKSNEKNSNHNH